MRIVTSKARQLTRRTMKVLWCLSQKRRRGVYELGTKTAGLQQQGVNRSPEGTIDETLFLETDPETEGQECMREREQESKRARECRFLGIARVSFGQTTVMMGRIMEGKDEGREKQTEARALLIS